MCVSVCVCVCVCVVSVCVCVCKRVCVCERVHFMPFLLHLKKIVIFYKFYDFN